MGRTFSRSGSRTTYVGKKGRGKGGGGGTTTTPPPPADTTPDAFSFTDVTDAELSDEVRSGSVAITGITAETTVTVSGFEYTLDGGATWTDLPGTVQPNGTLELRDPDTPNTNDTLVSGSVTVGGFTANWAIRTKAADPAPGETIILFGSNTRSGYGGATGDWASDATITVTEGSTDWTLNAARELVPSGTYGAVKTFSKSAGQSYSLVFSDATEVTVTMVGGVAHCAANSADTSTSFQLRTYLTTAGFSGDIVCRDGRLNDLAALWRIRPPAAGFGSAITVRSENPTEGNDDHGNPTRGGGFSIGAIAFDGSLLPVIPVTFEDVLFYNDVNDSAHSGFISWTSPTVGRGVGALRCRFENASGVDVANLKDAINLRGATALQCAFKRVRKGVAGGLELGEAVTRIAECVMRQPSNDAVQLIGQNYIIEDNFAYDFLSNPGAHPDGAQNYGVNPINYTLPMIHRRNIWVMNTGVWYQGDFISDKPSPYFCEAVTVENEIILTGYRAVTITRGTGAVVRNCLGIRMPELAAALGNSYIDVSTCVNTTVDSCVSNSFSLGSATGTNNKELPSTLAAAQVAMPSFPSNVAAPGFTSRAAVIAACTPANLAIASGGFKKADGSYVGPLNAAGAYQ